MGEPGAAPSRWQPSTPTRMNGVQLFPVMDGTSTSVRTGKGEPEATTSTWRTATQTPGQRLSAWAIRSTRRRMKSTRRHPPTTGSFISRPTGYPTATSGTSTSPSASGRPPPRRLQKATRSWSPHRATAGDSPRPPAYRETTGSRRTTMTASGTREKALLVTGSLPSSPKKMARPSNCRDRPFFSAGNSRSARG